jgi:hypothetical protein
MEKDANENSTILYVGKGSILMYTNISGKHTLVCACAWVSQNVLVGYVLKLLPMLLVELQWPHQPNQLWNISIRVSLTSYYVFKLIFKDEWQKLGGVCILTSRHFIISTSKGGLYMKLTTKTLILGSKNDCQYQHWG